MNLINVVKNIGIVCICNEEELMLLLPNFPKLLGNEFLFSVSWLELIKELKSSHDFEHFIKGLHIVELKYRDNRMEARKIKLNEIVSVLKKEIELEYSKFNLNNI